MGFFFFYSSNKKIPREEKQSGLYIAEFNHCYNFVECIFFSLPFLNVQTTNKKKKREREKNMINNRK